MFGIASSSTSATKCVQRELHDGIVSLKNPKKLSIANATLHTESARRKNVLDSRNCELGVSRYRDPFGFMKSTSSGATTSEKVFTPIGKDVASLCWMDAFVRLSFSQEA